MVSSNSSASAGAANAYEAGRGRVEEWLRRTAGELQAEAQLLKNRVCSAEKKIEQAAAVERRGKILSCAIALFFLSLMFFPWVHFTHTLHIFMLCYTLATWVHQAAEGAAGAEQQFGFWFSVARALDVMRRLVGLDPTCNWSWPWQRPSVSVSEPQHDPPESTSQHVQTLKLEVQALEFRVVTAEQNAAFGRHQAEFWAETAVVQIIALLIPCLFVFSLLFILWAFGEIYLAPFILMISLFLMFFMTIVTMFILLYDAVEAVQRRGFSFYAQQLFSSIRARLHQD